MGDNIEGRASVPYRLRFHQIESFFHFSIGRNAVETRVGYYFGSVFIGRGRFLFCCVSFFFYSICFDWTRNSPKLTDVRQIRDGFDDSRWIIEGIISLDLIFRKKELVLVTQFREIYYREV